jgi:hypothetical protein
MDYFAREGRPHRLLLTCAVKRRDNDMRCHMPPLKYERMACHACGAETESQAEKTCHPSSDETGEVSCGMEFDDGGYALGPTIESIREQDAWIDIHHDCGIVCRAAPALGQGEDKK